MMIPVPITDPIGKRAPPPARIGIGQAAWWRQRWRWARYHRRFYLAHIVQGGERWVGPFLEQVGGFKTLAVREIALHYAPCIEKELIPRLFLVACRQALERLARRFEFRLPPPAVYLFPSPDCIAALLGERYGGAAILHQNAILIGNSPRCEESLTHELAHLFSLRWNLNAPSLLGEGLSVYLQRTFAGYPIHALARRILRSQKGPLCRLLHEEYFFEPQERWERYALAGSFTGYLIEQHGWEAYSRMYREIGVDRMNAKFRRAFGVGFLEAEVAWRTFLNSRCQP